MYCAATVCGQKLRVLPTLQNAIVSVNGVGGSSVGTGH